MDEEILAGLGGTKSDLTGAVLHEVEERKCETLQQLGCELVAGWASSVRADRKGKTPPGPPVLPILATYVLAVNHGEEDNFSPHAYYDRLDALLGGPRCRVDSLKPSRRLWEALELWSKHLASGQYGVFEVGIVGQQAYVGVPRRQVLLSRQERAPLRRAFLAEGLRPGLYPSDRELYRSARSASGLMARTRRLLSRWPRDSVAKELLLEVREEFDAWHEVVDDDLSGPGERRLALRFGLRLDGARISAGWIEADLVRGLTDVEQGATIDESVSFHGDVDGLSVAPDEGGAQAVVVDEDGDPAWVEHVPWLDRITLRLEGSGAVLSRSEHKHLVFTRSQRARVLEEVRPEGLSDGEPAILVVRDPASSAADLSFVGSFRGEWAPFPVGPGLFFRPFAATAPATGERAPRIHLRGGVRSAPGTSGYLHFALPNVVAEAANDTSLRVRFVAMDSAGRELGRPQPLIERVSTDSPSSILADAGTKRARVFDFPELPGRAAYVQAELCRGEDRLSSCGLFVDRAPLEDDLGANPMTRDALGLPSREGAPAATKGTTALIEWQGADPRLPSTSRPPKWREDKAIAPAASRLMQLMRMRPRVRWSDARSWLPHCLSDTSDGAGVHLVNQVQALHSLGIVELEEAEYGGLESIVTLRPGLALIPRPLNLGFASTGNIEQGHEAILVGCWTPDEINALRKACRQRAVEFKVLRRAEELPLFPNRLTLLAQGENSIELLSRVASDMDLPLDTTVPLACRLASALGRVEDLANTPGWEPGAVSPEWKRRYFDPRAVALSQEEPDDRFVLLECQHPNRSVWQHFLWDRVEDRRFPLADRQLGRWFVRKLAMPDTPMPRSGGAILVPLELRLPRALERALVLSSGIAPSLTRYTPGSSPFSSPSTSRAFGIPAPPSRSVEWLVSRYFCTGNFCRYEGVYETAVWPRGEPIPMLGLKAQGVTTTDMQGKSR